MNKLEQQHATRQAAARIAWILLETIGRSMLICFVIIGAILATQRKEF